MQRRDGDSLGHHGDPRPVRAHRTSVRRPGTAVAAGRTRDSRAARGTPDFEEGRVTPEQFDHRAHVRLAYVYLTEGGVEAAAHAIRGALLAFLDRHGIDAEKYHETVTGRGFSRFGTSWSGHRRHNQHNRR